MLRDFSLNDASRNRLARRMPSLVAIPLLVLLAIQAARIVWLALVAPSPAGAPLLDLHSASAASEVVVDAFYPPSPEGTQGPEDPADLLGYRLYGLRGAMPGAGMPASAILAGKDGEQHAYQLGDSPARGIKLTAVSGDHVVLRSGGRDHRLFLPAMATPGPPAKGAPTPRGTLAGSGNDAPEPVSATTSIEVAPGDLMSNTGLRANLEGGYTLMPRGDGAFFKRAGLAAGDVLTSVDGRPLDLERLRGLEDELAAREQTVLTVKRNGETRTITLQATQP